MPLSGSQWDGETAELLETCHSSDVSATALLRHTGCSPSDREADHEAARVRSIGRQCGARVAARPARAAEDDAGDRVALRRQPAVAQHEFAGWGGVSQGTERDPLCRGTKPG